MKNTIIQVLSGLAIVQVLLVVVTWQQPDAAPPGSHDLLENDTADLQQITIASSGESASEVVLSHENDSWVLASAGNYPVAPNKIADLLEALGEITIQGEPITTTALSHDALQVASDDFGRQISLLNNSGEEQVFLIGRSSTGGLNIRLNDEENVFAGRGASLHAFRATAGDYVEREYVNLENLALSSILITNEEGQIALTQTETEEWVPDVITDGMVPNSEEISSLIDAITTIRMSQPSPIELQNETASVVWMSSNAEGEITQGALQIGETQDSYRRVRLQEEGAFTVLVSETALLPILNATASQLSMEEPEPEPETILDPMEE